ncbi:NADAR family protein [Janthinobacterium agaricidamnosum]|nr:NADAR family protein [Janthinobacterium agaricidamnosum]
MSSVNASTKFELLRTYTRSECVVFHRTKDPFGGLSNMAGGYAVTVNGVRFRTTEALYQACRFPQLPEVQRLVISEASPIVAKRKTMPFRDQTRKDWDSIRHKIMRWCLRVKLAQNYTEFGALLLSTGDGHIVEQSSKDTFWGARVIDQNTLAGENVLGRLLMELREDARIDEKQILRVVPPLPIPDFNLFGEPIEIVTAPNSEALHGYRSTMLF